MGGGEKPVGFGAHIQLRGSILGNMPKIFSPVWLHFKSIHYVIHFKSVFLYFMKHDDNSYFKVAVISGSVWGWHLLIVISLGFY